MENIRKFSKEIGDYYSQRLSVMEDFKEPKGEISIMDGFNIIDKISDCRINIVNKLLALNKENRDIYANLIITALDSGYPYTSGNSESDYDFTSSWEFFILEILDTFLYFGIDLSEIADKRKDLFSIDDFMGAYKANAKSMNKNDFLKERDSQRKRNGVSTCRQRVIAITQIMSEIYPGFESLDKTTQARFIQFLTGDESYINRIADTNIYKNLKGIGKIHISIDKSDNEINNYNNDVEIVAKQLDLLSMEVFSNKIRGLKEDFN